jgi:hypothetical protein
LDRTKTLTESNMTTKIPPTVNLRASLLIKITPFHKPFHPVPLRLVGDVSDVHVSIIAAAVVSVLVPPVSELRPLRLSEHLSRDFHFAFWLQANIPPVASALHLLCIHSKAKDPGVPSKAFAGTHKPSFAPFRSDFMDTSPLTLLRRPDWFHLPAAPIRLAAAKPESAPACFQTSAVSDGSLPTAANSSGHVLPTARRFSPTAVASL